LLIESPRPFDLALPVVRNALDSLVSSVALISSRLSTLQTTNNAGFAFLSLSLFPTLTAVLRVLDGRLGESSTLSFSTASVNTAIIAAANEKLAEFRVICPKPSPPAPISAEIDVHADGVITSLKKLFNLALRQGLPFLC
jgi:hypothetical protein